MGTPSEGIAFNATLVGIKTMPDGCWRVTLDVPHSDAPAVLKVAETRDKSVTVAIIPHPALVSSEESPRWG